MVPNVLLDAVSTRLDATAAQTEINHLGSYEWGRLHFPHHLTSKFSVGQQAIWDWADAMPIATAPEPLIVIMARGSGKSTSAELVVSMIGAKKKRFYVLYVRCTQSQADLSVSNISSLLTNNIIQANYPKLAEKKLDHFGASQGWRTSFLRTASGFTVEGIGLDSATRGAKVENQRPDFIIFDDIDEKFDTELTTRKKIDAITSTILPAGSSNVAILGIQNLMIPNGIFSQLVDRKVDFLNDANIVGPIPAVENLVYETDKKGLVTVTGGDPTWEGQDLNVVQSQMRRWGVEVFLKEAQHQVHIKKNALFKQSQIQHIDYKPMFVRIVTSIDVATWSGRCGIVTCGLDDEGNVTVVQSQSCEADPSEWTKLAIEQFYNHGSDCIVYERNQGGRMIPFSVNSVDPNVPCSDVLATRSKTIRAEPIQIFYDQGVVKHYGHHPELEGQMIRWVLGEKSPDLLDAMVWGVTDLKGLSLDKATVEAAKRNLYQGFATGGIQRRYAQATL